MMDHRFEVLEEAEKALPILLQSPKNWKGYTGEVEGVKIECLAYPLEAHGKAFILQRLTATRPSLVMRGECEHTGRVLVGSFNLVLLEEIPEGNLVGYAEIGRFSIGPNKPFSFREGTVFINELATPLVLEIFVTSEPPPPELSALSESTACEILETFRSFYPTETAREAAYERVHGD